MSKKDKLLSQVKSNLEDSSVEYTAPQESATTRTEIEGTKRLKNAREIPITKIQPDPDQPRKKLDPDKLQELADSIKEHGILQPISVQFVENEEGGFYKIISGERRWQAAKRIDLDVLPCIISNDVTADDRYARQIIENIQREDLSPIEKAMSLVDYKSRLGDEVPWEAVEKKTGLSRRRRQQFTALLNLPQAIQNEIVETGRRPAQNEITEKHARALLALNDQPEKQLELFSLIKTSKTPLTGDLAIEKAKEFKGAKTFLKFSVSYETEQDLLKILQSKVKELKESLKENKG